MTEREKGPGPDDAISFVFIIPGEQYAAKMGETYGGLAHGNFTRLPDAQGWVEEMERANADRKGAPDAEG